MTDSDWSDIRERLARLAAEPNAGEIFGAESHEWQLEPPLSVAELKEIEEQVGVELPGEYRSFLLEVGRGGAGPSYGLNPLYRMDGRWRLGGDHSGWGLSGLAQPFPHVEAFYPAEELDEPDEDDYDSEEAFQDAYDVYREERLEIISENMFGLLCLCHLGCGAFEVLVVSGPARGQMWADYIVEDSGLEPLVDDDGTPLGFARWYRQWLDSTEAQVSRGLRA